MFDWLREKGKQLWKRDTVLCISFVLAILSCFLNPPSPAYLDFIDTHTLILLFCLMLAVEGMREEGVFGVIASVFLRRVRTKRGIVLSLVALCFFSSMLITNDVSLITFVPFSLMILETAGMKKRLPLTLTLITIAANLGSALTPIGNPQNIYLYERAGMALPTFLQLMAPYALGAAVLLALSSFFAYPSGHAVVSLPTAKVENTRQTAVYFGLFLLSIATVVGFVPHEVLLLVAVIAVGFVNRRLFLRIDYGLLLTFAFFFIFVGNLDSLDALHDWIAAVVVGRERLLSVLLSQGISNVPAAMLLSHYTTNVPELLVGTNLGGLGTLIASMASLITYKNFTAKYPELRARYLLVFTAWNVIFLLLLVWI